MPTESPREWTKSRGFTLFFAFLFAIIAVMAWFNTDPSNVWGAVTASIISVAMLLCSFWASDNACEAITFWLFV